MKKLINLVAIVSLIMAFASCKTMKIAQHSISDSTVVHVRDSIIVKDSVVYRDSVVMRDSFIGVHGSETHLELPAASTDDTTSEEGNVSVHRYVDKGGIEHIDCKADSLTIEVRNLTYIYRSVSKSYDSLSSKVDSCNHVRSEVTVKQVQQSWWGRLWGNVEKYLAWIGLVCVLYCIWRVVKRFIV